MHIDKGRNAFVVSALILLASKIYADIFEFEAEPKRVVGDHELLDAGFQIGSITDDINVSDFVGSPTGVSKCYPIDLPKDYEVVQITHTRSGYQKIPKNEGDKEVNKEGSLDTEAVVPYINVIEGETGRKEPENNWNEPSTIALFLTNDCTGQRELLELTPSDMDAPATTTVDLRNLNVGGVGQTQWADLRQPYRSFVIYDRVANMEILTTAFMGRADWKFYMNMDGTAKIPSVPHSVGNDIANFIQTDQNELDFVSGKVNENAKKDMKNYRNTVD